MMHNANHQETEPHCTDPAALASDADRYEAGRNQAASMDPKARMVHYRAMYRAGVDAFSRGFRDLTLGDHEAARR